MGSGPTFDDSDLGEIRSIVAIASEESGVDFSAYRKEALTRRIQHRMRITGCEDVAAYLRRLEGEAAERMRLVDALLIKTTHPFRGPATFEVLRGRLLPELVARRAREGATVLRAWSAGASTGLEALSLALCLLEARDASAARMEVRVLGSDVDGDALAQATRGRVEPEDLAAIPGELRARYLEPAEAGGAVPNARVRACLSFVRHDLLGKIVAPPTSVFASFDVVACRNLLIYLRPTAQVRALQRLAAACEPGGLLVLDETETPPDALLPQLSRAAAHVSIWRPRGR